MKCEHFGKEIPEVVLVHKVKPVTQTLSDLSKAYNLFRSEACQRLKSEEGWQKSHPHG